MLWYSTRSCAWLQCCYCPSGPGGSASSPLGSSESEPAAPPAPRCSGPPHPARCPYSEAHRRRPPGRDGALEPATQSKPMGELWFLLMEVMAVGWWRLRALKNKPLMCFGWEHTALYVVAEMFYCLSFLSADGLRSLAVWRLSCGVTSNMIGWECNTPIVKLTQLNTLSQENTDYWLPAKLHSEGIPLVGSTLVVSRRCNIGFDFLDHSCQWLERLGAPLVVLVSPWKAQTLFVIRCQEDKLCTWTMQHIIGGWIGLNSNQDKNIFQARVNGERAVSVETASLWFAQGITETSRTN